MPDDPYAPSPERALLMTQGLEEECNAEIRRLTRPKGGQQVSETGDFIGVPLPRLHKIKWWTREIRRCLGDTRRDID